MIAKTAPAEFRVELTLTVDQLEKHYRGFTDRELKRTASRYNTLGREHLAVRLWSVAANAELARRKKAAGNE